MPGGNHLATSTPKRKASEMIAGRIASAPCEDRRCDAASRTTLGVSAANQTPKRTYAQAGRNGNDQTVYYILISYHHQCWSVATFSFRKLSIVHSARESAAASFGVSCPNCRECLP